MMGHENLSNQISPARSKHLAWEDGDLKLIKNGPVEPDHQGGNRGRDADHQETASHTQAAGSRPDDEVIVKKRKSGIPTGNAGEYFVMGELLRRGFDA